MVELVLRTTPTRAIKHWKIVPDMMFTLAILVTAPPTLMWGNIASMLIPILRDWVLADIWRTLEHGKLFQHGVQRAEISIFETTGIGRGRVFLIMNGKENHFIPVSSVPKHHSFPRSQLGLTQER